MSVKVVFAGGGTGGHVIPAMAVAGEVVRRGGRVRFIGSSDRLEARLVPKAGYGIDFIKVRPLVGGGTIGFMRGALSVPAALLRAGMLLRRLKPNVVLGVGGYVAGPVVMAAKFMGIPSAVLEQNAAVGLTNKILSRFIDRAYVAYEEAAGAFDPGITEVTGNPVDRSLIEAAAERKVRDDGVVRILVMGGSQGARAIDERVPASIAHGELTDNVTVVHQCSGANADTVRAKYKEAGVDASVLGFIDDMATAYKEADLVVARSGATTIAELTAVGLPAVLLPYPHHADNQQERNARRMSDKGAAVILDEKETDVADMAGAIGDFVRDPKRRLEASAQSASLGKPEAASVIASGLFALSGVRA